MTSKQGGLLLGIACAACCAPLLLPLIAGTSIATGLAVMANYLLICGALALGIGLGALWLIRRRRQRKARECTCANQCDPACGCAPTAQHPAPG